MILLTAGRVETTVLDALLVLAARLEARGHAVAIDDAALPEATERNLRHEAARFMTPVADCRPDYVICLAPGAIDPDQLVHLRRIETAPGARSALLGRFADHQSRLSAEAGLSFALGQLPSVVDLATLGPRPLSGSALGLVHAERHPPRPAPERPVFGVFLSRDEIEAPETLPALSALHHGGRVRLVVVSDGAGREKIRASRHVDLETYRHSEISALGFAGLLDAAAVYRDTPVRDRLGGILTEMVQRAKPVIDGTPGRMFAATRAPVLPGPASVAGLAAYVDATLLPHFAAISARMAADPWSESADLRHLEGALGLAPPQGAGRAAPRATVHPSRTVFVPTNGVGLGHARRCLLVAAAMDTPADLAFAAFPSCIPMIRGAGHACLPLVAKDDEHAEPGDNDLVNGRRLARALGPGDRLVFDGGYVFGSVFRAIMEKRLPAVWMRRGLWQAGQRAGEVTQREKAFSRVIVPGEAFAELNDPLSFGPRIAHVGPVVDRVAPDFDRGRFRDDLAATAGRNFRRLVVTMLGGGVAADRGAQTIALCTLMERRADTLHLIVSWPGARIPPGLSGYRASRVVQTDAGLDLICAADLVISAAGYNSFHEIIYHGAPAIFVPQMAPYMDDQLRRARAASDRGLAITVEGHELLSLKEAVGRMLDDDLATEIAARLSSEVLPARGTTTAAALIEGTLE